MKVTNISKKEFYSLLKEVYIEEMKWKIGKSNSSNIRVENGQLVDDFYDDAYYFGFCLDGKPVFGFRLIENSKEIIRYSNNTDLLAIAEQSMEISRLVTHKDIRSMGIGLLKLTAKISLDFSRKKKKSFCITATEHKKLNKIYRSVPQVKVLENAINYPEGVCDGFIFPTNNAIVKWSVFEGRNKEKLTSIYNEIHGKSEWFRDQ